MLSNSHHLTWLNELKNDDGGLQRHAQVEILSLPPEDRLFQMRWLMPVYVEGLLTYALVFPELRNNP